MGFGGEGRVLLVVAAAAEARAALSACNGPVNAAERAWRLIPLTDRLDLAVAGVGKANAAGCTAAVFDRARHGCVLSVGVCGALGAFGPALRTVVLGDESVYADEGLELTGSFLDVSAMGFAPCESADAEGAPGVRADAALLDALRPLAGVVGPIATVSTGAGTDARAVEIVRRTGAVAEAMEGAAVGVALRRLADARGEAPARFTEIRVVSNSTGDRDHQAWDLKGALDALSGLVAAL